VFSPTRVNFYQMNNNTNLYFSTYTNLCWIPVLENDEYKNIIIDSLRFLVEDGRIVLYGFVIMPNHIHLIWQIGDKYKLKDVQRDFLKYTSQMIRFKMIESKDGVPSELIVNSRDRKVQIWERNGLSFMLFGYEMALEKLEYIHKNPMSKKWSLCNSIEEYKYSSYNFYFSKKNEYDFISNIVEIR